MIALMLKAMAPNKAKSSPGSRLEGLDGFNAARLSWQMNIQEKGAPQGAFLEQEGMPLAASLLREGDFALLLHRRERHDDHQQQGSGQQAG